MNILTLGSAKSLPLFLTLALYRAMESPFRPLLFLLKPSLFDSFSKGILSENHTAASLHPAARQNPLKMVLLLSVLCNVSQEDYVENAISSTDHPTVNKILDYLNL